MRIPTKKTCFELMRRMQMMDHIRAHSIQVCRVATTLVVSLAAHPSPPDLGLVQAAALLHDITKTRSFETGEKHAATGADFLISMGYAEVGRIVGQHVELDAYLSASFPTAAEIVNYADKRVLHDTVVSLKERMAYIDERYGKTDADRDRLASLRKLTQDLERWIFKFLPFSPEVLIEHLDGDCIFEIAGRRF